MVESHVGCLVGSHEGKLTYLHFLAGRVGYSGSILDST